MSFASAMGCVETVMNMVVQQCIALFQTRLPPIRTHREKFERWATILHLNYVETAMSCDGAVMCYVVLNLSLLQQLY